MLQDLLQTSHAVGPALRSEEPEPRTLTERAYRALRHHIVCGELQPDQRLRVEHLKNHYGVGAGTLREALALLVSDALVTVEGQRGYRVSSISLDDLRDLTDTRVRLETEALRQSIRLGDAAWEASVRESFARLSESEFGGAGRNPEQWERANRRFHEALIAGYGSPWTRHLLDILYRHGERYRHVAIRLGATPGFDRDVHAEHEGIFTAALARQEARAALALEAHIRLTCDILTRHAANHPVHAEPMPGPTAASLYPSGSLKLTEKTSKTPAYKAWSRIVHCVTNPNSKDFMPGVALHPGWADFQKFLKDVGQPPEKGQVLVRLDNSQGFTSDNCVWMGKSEASQRNAAQMKQAGTLVGRGKKSNAMDGQKRPSGAN